MEANDVHFSEVEAPKTQEYDLGNLQDVYVETISDLLDTSEENLKNKKFSCSRYTVLTYLTPEAKSKYMSKFIELFNTDFALIE